jgi:hypothetical protein
LDTILSSQNLSSLRRLSLSLFLHIARTDEALLANMPIAMVDKDSFETFVENIVRQTLPDETLPYRIGARELVDQLFAGKDIRNQNSLARGEFEFIGEATEVLKFVGVLWSTYQVLQQAYHQWTARKKQIDIAAIKEQWRTALKQSGLSDSMAAAISDKFAEQLPALVK